MLVIYHTNAKCYPVNNTTEDSEGDKDDIDKDDREGRS